MTIECQPLCPPIVTIVATKIFCFNEPCFIQNLNVVSDFFSWVPGNSYLNQAYWVRLCFYLQQKVSYQIFVQLHEPSTSTRITVVSKATQ